MSTMAPSGWCVIPVSRRDAPAAADLVRIAVKSGAALGVPALVVIYGDRAEPLAAGIPGAGAVMLDRQGFTRAEALLSAAHEIHARGGRFMAALDPRARYSADDMAALMAGARADGAAVVIGCPPWSRSRRWSDLLVRLITGVAADGSTSRFRAYPVDHLTRLKLKGRWRDFETEALVKSLWAGLSACVVPVSAASAPPPHRASPADAARTIFTYAALMARRLWPWPHRRLVTCAGTGPKVRRSVAQVIADLLREHATPPELAASAAVGTFLAILPLISAHTVAILYVTTRLNMNRIMAVSIQNLFMPPFAPLACIELGYYLRHGCWLTEATRETVLAQAPDRLLDWLIGSLILGPLAAVILGAAIFGIARRLQGRMATHG